MDIQCVSVVSGFEHDLFHWLDMNDDGKVCMCVCHVMYQCVYVYQTHGMHTYMMVYTRIYVHTYIYIEYCAYAASYILCV